MKEAIWYATVVFFDLAYIVLYYTLVWHGVKYFASKIEGVKYVISIPDPRKRERIIRSQSRRGHLVLGFMAAALIMAPTYIIGGIDVLIDLDTPTIQASWSIYAIYLWANLFNTFFVYIAILAIQMFTDEENGLYCDGLKDTYKDME